MGHTSLWCRCLFAAELVLVAQRYHKAFPACGICASGSAIFIFIVVVEVERDAGVEHDTTRTQLVLNATATNDAEVEAVVLAAITGIAVVEFDFVFHADFIRSQGGFSVEGISHTWPRHQVSPEAACTEAQLGEDGGFDVVHLYFQGKAIGFFKVDFAGFLDEIEFGLDGEVCAEANLERDDVVVAESHSVSHCLAIAFDGEIFYGEHAEPATHTHGVLCVNACGHEQKSCCGDLENVGRFHFLSCFKNFLIELMAQYSA